MPKNVMSALMRIPKQLHHRRLYSKNVWVHENHRLVVHYAGRTDIWKVASGDQGDRTTLKVVAGNRDSRDLGMRNCRKEQPRGN
jgi:hypothetical protein